MKTRTLLSVLFVAVTALAGCKKAADFTKYKTEITELASKYAPQLAELSKKIPDLLAKAKALPVSIPGVDKLGALLAGSQDEIAKIQGLIGGASAKIDAAIKTGDLKQVEAVVTEGAEVGAKLTKITADVAQAEADIVKFEAEAAAGGAVAAAATEFMKKLSSGFELKGAVGGIEEKLVAFIDDAAKPVDEKTWFSFDRLTFQTGKADLDMDKSKAQLDNIKEIMGAYPALKLKLGGYTDNVGDAKANQKLSGERAQNVMKALVAAGIKADRLAAEGYGQEHPVCPANDTDECKAQNRRIDVRVTAK